MRTLDSYISKNELQKLVDFALAEDIGEGDITSKGALSAEQYTAKASATLLAKSDGFLSGSEIFAQVCSSLDNNISCAFDIHDGQNYTRGDIVAEITGPTGTLLQAERTALNFIGKLSGIASLTSRYVQAVSKTNCKILDTRKTTPGWRALEKYAVNCGGALNHRQGLYDMILIKENHIRAAGSISQAIENVRKHITDSNLSEILIEVEIQNQTELEEALKENVDRVLLDNLTPSELNEMVILARKLSPNTHLEASGNITLENVAERASSGVDFISIGALTHSAKTADLSLLFA